MNEVLKNNKDFKNGRFAKEIISLQKEDGSWGYFHTLSKPTNKQSLTTEQALRRLEKLGFTINDVVIQKAIGYLSDCLNGKKTIPDRREKRHDWDIFVQMMLSTWIIRFTDDNDFANKVAQNWADIISYAFKTGSYNQEDFNNRYYQVFKKKPFGNRLIDIVTFYQISLVSKLLYQEISLLFIDYILNNDSGIYYIYDKPLKQLPNSFPSLNTVRFLNAIDLLAEYNYWEIKLKLKYVYEWLLSNQVEEGVWDLSVKANDKISFPLSDSWRKSHDRLDDCSYRIKKLIKILKMDTT